MKRAEAHALLMEKLKADNLIKHSLATEAIMRALARRFSADEEQWGMTGLLHDLDLEIVGDDMSTHAQVTADLLAAAGFPEEGIQAIRMHNAEGLSLGERESRFEHCLAAAETVTGLIVATALVLPSKSLADVKARSVRKRMKEAAFARGARREVIMECEEAGLPLDEFIDISLEAMREIAPELGL